MVSLTQIQRLALTILFLAALSCSAAAQIPGIPGVKGAKSEGPPQPPPDPLGRSTPRGTITAFVRAVEREDFVSAARDMQLTQKQRQNSETLARDLKALMDRFLSTTLISISDAPNGALDDGLPTDQERVGPLVIGEKKTDILLVRVPDKESGPIWLISSQTLGQVPALRDSIAQTWVERTMPQSLVSRSLLGMSLAYWVLLFASLIVPFGLMAAISLGFVVHARRTPHATEQRSRLDLWHSGIRWPLITVLTLVIHLMSMRTLRMPLAARLNYSRVALVALVIALAWLARRVLTIALTHARNMLGKNRASTQSLMLLGERLGKAIVVVAAVMAILVIVGVDTSTALAGLGIGGVALALGGQKTVENLLGGIFLLTDRVLAVGDLCSISNRLGFVEDITLRSVRLRTLDQTLVSVPAGILAQAGIENFATRKKILVQTTLGLRYGTSTEQMRRILAGIRASLDANPRIERGSRIRLANFGKQAVELELFAYVLTTDAQEFFAVREAVLLEIAGIVEEAGSGFAMPTQFVYMDPAPNASMQTAPARSGGLVDISKAR
jgi:MscS family membrane protein